MKTLVTGGGGFLGNHIVDRLLAEGRSVRVIGRTPRPELEARGVEVVRGDLSHRFDCDRAVEGCEIVHHSAALAGVWGKAKQYEKTNVEGSFHLLEASKKLGVKAFVYTSSPSVVFDGQNHHMGDESLPYPKKYLCHYPRSKAIAERMVLACHDSHGMGTLALRPHLFWGKGDPHLVPRILDRAKKGRLRQVGPGGNKVHMVHVKNAAHAHLLAEKALLDQKDVGGKAFFITDNDPVDLWEWIKNLLQASGIPWDPKPISSTLAFNTGAFLELFHKLLMLPGEPPMTRFVARQLSTTHTFDTTRAKELLGYEPIVTQEEGMKELLEL